MDEQNKINENLEQTVQMQPVDGTVLQPASLHKNKKFKLLIMAIILLIIIVGLGFFVWYIVNSNQKNSIIKKEDIIVAELSVFEKERLLRMQANCQKFDGLWQDGKCLTSRCLDTDAFEGADGKYIRGSIEYVSKNAVLNTAQDSCVQNDKNLFVKELVCAEEKAGSGYFTSSYIDYECENGCDNGACQRLPYKLEGINLDHIILFYNIDDSKPVGGDNEILIRSNGLIICSLGDNKECQSSILSEAEYRTLVQLLLENDSYFIHSSDEDDYDNNKYYDKNLKGNYGYSIRYGYYLSEADKINENIQIKGITCHLDKCPKTLNDLLYKIIAVTPRYSYKFENVQANNICDKCDDADKPEQCWNDCQKPSDLEIIFQAILTKEYSTDLSLEEAYTIVLPYVKQWADDAVLVAYETNIATVEKNFKVNYYTFFSQKKDKSLTILFNDTLYKEGTKDSAGLTGEPLNFVVTKKFNVLENEMFFSQTDTEYVLKEKSLYFDKLIGSEEIINKAKKSGLENLILKNTGTQLLESSVSLAKNQDKLNWILRVSYANKSKDVVSFVASYDAETGELLAE